MGVVDWSFLLWCDIVCFQYLTLIMTDNQFEKIKHVNEYGAEYWKARELARTLEYSDFGNFENVIKKAMTACKNSNQAVEDHFGEATEMVKIGLEVKRGFPSYHLSRYACYLIVQNADPKKEVVALGQTYFAFQTRRQEEADQRLEDKKRVVLRGEMKTHNKKLAKAAGEAGVVNYGVFQNYGYLGLYGGLGQKEIHSKKGLKKSQKILDHMGSEELAANLFRTTQTEAKLKRENVQGQENASRTHNQVGKKVRKTIKALGGTMPEELPVTDSVKKAEKRLGSDDLEVFPEKFDE